MYDSKVLGYECSVVVAQTLQLGQTLGILHPAALRATVCCAVLCCGRGSSGTYRVDGVGLVWSESGRTFVANLTDGDWTAYTIMTEEAEYDITMQVKFNHHCCVKKYQLES